MKAAPVEELISVGEWASFAPGLGRVKTCLEKLKQPHVSWPHYLVAGTNGKGTVSYNLAKSLGPNTGLFLSPHVQNVRERITLAGTWFPDQAWIQARDRIRQAWPDAELSYFEWLLLLAVVMFDEAKVPAAVFEVGLGGRLDATNALSPELSILTNVSLDHQKLLGPTVEAIALEKIEIARPAKPFVLPHAVLEMARVKQRLEEVVCHPYSVFHGEHGFQNNLASLNQALQLLKLPPRKHLDMLPGRRETLPLGEGIYLDGAHNEAGWRDLVRHMQAKGHSKIQVLASLSKDREVNKFLIFLEPIADGFFHWQAGFEKEQPRDAWPDQVQIISKSQLVSLLERPLLVCGSLYFVGAFKAWLIDEGFMAAS